MEQARFFKAVADLRQWVDGPEPGRCPARQAGIELLRLASEVADSLPDPACSKLLQERARRYYEAIESPFFQSMCDLARHLVLTSWHSVAAQTGRLPAMPDNVVVAEEQVPEWLLLLSRLTDEPERRPQDRLLSSSRLSRPVEGTQTLTATSILPDLRQFTLPLQGVVVGHDLASHFWRLERIATFFEGEADPGEELTAMGSRKSFRRLISYFFGILSWADNGLLRGSFLIVGCHDSLKGSDGFHKSNLFAEWLTTDLKGTAGVILAAAEGLACRGEEEASRPVPSLPPGVDSRVIAEHRADAVEVSGEQVPQAQEQEDFTDDDDEAWADINSHPPEGFHDTPLAGQKWQIAWALEKAGVLVKGTPKVLDGKVKIKMTLWGKRSGRGKKVKGDHFVYIRREKRDPDRDQRALQALQIIKAGHYHPEEYPLPKAYKGNQSLPLKARAEEILAQVLHEVDLLKDPTVASLHKTIAAGGTLFGRIEGELVTLYFSKRIPEAKLREARELLQSKQDSARSASGE